MNDLIRQHKRLAMGEDVAPETSTDGGWPGRGSTAKEAPLTRGEGRQPDARKSGMPSGQATRPLWLDVGDVANPGDRITVKEHTRGKPGGMGWE